MQATILAIGSHLQAQLKATRYWKLIFIIFFNVSNTKIISIQVFVPQEVRAENMKSKIQTTGLLFCPQGTSSIKNSLLQISNALFTASRSASRGTNWHRWWWRGRNVHRWWSAAWLRANLHTMMDTDGGTRRWGWSG